MAHQYAKLAFTDTVRKVQSEHNSRKGYVGMDQGEDYNYLLSKNEADFIHARDSFYMASVGETGWPYVQHRGGPKGFMHVLDESTLGFSDFSGNRQYVSTGNFRSNNRVSLFFMDYPNRRRLKMMGRIELVDDSNWELMAKLEKASSGAGEGDGTSGSYRANVERGFVIHIEAFDWNCPQHITPRFSEEEIEQAIAPLIAENKTLKQQLAEIEAAAVTKVTADTSREQLPSIEHKSLVLGSGELPLVISGIRQLTPRIRAYELRHINGDALPAVTAGAHLQLPVLINNQQEMRHYSICSNPRRTDIYEVAVLKEEAGQGGSVAIHQEYQLGQKVNCHLPTNHFELHHGDAPAVLIAGGIGITPIKAMAQALQCRGNELTIHYSGRSLAEMAFQDRLERAFSGDIQFYSTALGQRLNIQRMMQQAPNDAIFYVCGPAALIDGVIAVGKSLAINSERIRYERFASVIDGQAKAIRVILEKSKKIIEVAKDETILDALLERGIDVPFSCKSGECKTCAVKVVSGKPQHLDNSLSDFEHEEKRLMCPCVSRSLDDDLVLDL
jgi:ferredoxin-NADP reductase/predicted pyridoxine 5'-phosphate oxidase superfamily flavin-nucleotide-binding protein